MAAEAGPSDALDEDELEELEELQEPPFPEPPPRVMLLCDLLGLAAEVETAAAVHDCECKCSPTLAVAAAIAVESVLSSPAAHGCSKQSLGVYLAALLHCMHVPRPLTGRSSEQL
jgi:hypothetical protein